MSESNNPDRYLDWHPITHGPVNPVQVEVYFGNMGDVYVVEPYRDCRRALAYWDGDVFRELDTGHSLFEDWRTEEFMPTHWRVLPASPSVLGR